MNYQQQYYPNYTYQAQSPLISQTQPQKQEQTSAFISVANEEQARNWPIGPGNSLTFKDESAPYIYTKTMGFSQFDQPVFEKYRITKEEDINPDTASINSLQAEMCEVKDAYKLLKSEIDEMKNWMRQPFMAPPKGDNYE